MMVRTFVMVNIWSKINVTTKDLRTAEDISRNITQGMQQKWEWKLSRRVSYEIRLFTPVSLHLTLNEVHKHEDRMDQLVNGGKASLSLHWARGPLCVCGLDVCFAAALDQWAVPSRTGNTGESRASQALRVAHCHLGNGLQGCDSSSPTPPLYSRRRVQWGPLRCHGPECARRHVLECAWSYSQWPGSGITQHLSGWVISAGHPGVYSVLPHLYSAA